MKPVISIPMLFWLLNMVCWVWLACAMRLMKHLAAKALGALTLR